MENLEFNNIVNLFKQMTIEEKKEAILFELKKALAVTEKLSIDIENKREILINKEILDINKENATEDDYLEAVFVYLHMLEDSFMKFIEKITENFYE